MAFLGKKVSLNLTALGITPLYFHFCTFLLSPVILCFYFCRASMCIIPVGFIQERDAPTYLTGASTLRSSKP